MTEQTELMTLDAKLIIQSAHVSQQSNTLDLKLEETKLSVQFVLLVGIMEKFLVIGCSKTYGKECFHLTLPSRKHFAVQGVEGVASNRNMGLMYTCKFLKCVIHCPCRICRDERRN